MNIHYRVAEMDDVFRLMELYQKYTPSEGSDPIFLSYSRLEATLKGETALFLVAEEAGVLRGAISTGLDRSQRIAKLYRMLFDAGLPDPHPMLRELLDFAVKELKRRVPDLDLIYSTSLTLSPESIQITEDYGFRLLGIFPNAVSEDRSALNGLTAYFFPGVLEEKRMSGFALHPALHSLFSITREVCGLPELPADPSVHEIDRQEMTSAVPELERIDARKFVQNRFLQLKASQSLDTYYPFYMPNVLICSPDEEIEVFARLDAATRFAAVIGERIRKSVDPVALEIAVSNLLRQCGSSYVEVINDAADTLGNEAFLRAGFTPCAYFPCLKLHGEQRRDYVIFGRSFEYVVHPSSKIPVLYRRYFDAYSEIELRRYGILNR